MQELSQVLQAENDVYVVAFEQILAVHAVEPAFTVQEVFFKLHNAWVYNPVPTNIEVHAVVAATAVQVPASLVPIHSTVEVLVQLARDA